jgi:tRNA(Ile)-lysidine synthase
MSTVGQFLDRQVLRTTDMVVAVSGGPDSVALLLALAESQEPSNGRGLVVAHLNHQLRGRESDEDEVFVSRLVDQLRTSGLAEIRYQSACVDVAATARKTGDNLEGTARKLRYAWLAGIGRNTGIRVVATGHTADDQAETVLHRLLRGSGFKGLSGIAARRTLSKGIDVVRPLLGVTRSEVLAYLASKNQEVRIDSSNSDVRYTRNRIRHELLPLIRSNYNPAVARVLCNLAQQAREYEKDQVRRARQLLAKSELPRAGRSVVLEREALRSAPRILVKVTLRLIWEREGWPRGAMNAAAWQRLAAVVLGKTPATDLPGGFRAMGRQSVVLIGPAL